MTPKNDKTAKFDAPSDAPSDAPADAPADETTRSAEVAPSESQPITDAPAVDGDAPVTSSDTKKAIEAWCEEKATPEWLFRAARVFNDWPTCREMTEAAYVAGINAAASVPCR